MSREAVAWRAQDAEHTALQVGRRPVQALWPLLRPNFRTVFLAPERRAGSGVVIWRWRGAQKPAAPSAADLAGLRRRLGHAMQDLSTELDHREGVVAGVGSWELHVTMEKLVGALTEATDARLAAHAVQTESGWLIRSWGFATPGAAEIETTSESSEAEPEGAVAPEPESVSATEPAAKRGWLPPLIWSAGAVVLVGGLVFAYWSGWFTPSAIREQYEGVDSSGIRAASSGGAGHAATKQSTPQSSSHSAPGGGVGGVIGLKPIRAELGLPASAPLSLTSGLSSTTQAGSAPADTLAPAVIPGATFGGMKGGPVAAEDNAGPSGAPAAADEPGSRSAEKNGADTTDRPEESGGARAGKGSDAQNGSKAEASPKPDAKSPGPNSNKSQSESPGKTASEDSVPPAASKSAAKPEILARQAASAAKASGLPPEGGAKEVKDAAVSSDDTQGVARTVAVVQIPGRKTPSSAGPPAAAEKPKAPAERTAEPENAKSSREKAKAPAASLKSSGIPENPVTAIAKPEEPGVRPAPVERETPESSDPADSAPQNSTKQRVVVQEWVRETDGSEGRAGGGAEPVAARMADNEMRSWAYRVGEWRLRRVRDVVLATAPRPESDSAAANALVDARSKAWAEARRRVPRMFYEPSVRSGWRFELPPAAWPAAWTASAGEAVVSISAERSRGAQISWPGLMPAEPVEARLVGADGLELVRITIAAAERKIRLRVSTGQVLAVPEFSIQEAPDGSAPADLAWRSLVRSRWSDAHWATGREGGILRVLCNPEAGAEFAVRSGTLGLVDAVSGWALGVELRLE